MSSNAAAVLYRIYELPWSTGAAEEQKFRKSALTALAVVVLLALLISMLPVPTPDPTQVEEVPRRIARLVLEREAPPPPPPVVREEPKPEPEPEPVVEQRQVREEPPPKPEPKPEPKPVDRTQQAKERASVAGLLPFAQQLASLRDDNTAQRLDRAQVSGAVQGTTPLAERSLITSRVGASSGGINTAALSRNTGGGGLGDRAVTQVENPVESFELAGGAAQRSGESDKASRSREEIERVFDQNKGAIYTLYNRALRQNPALQGKLVLRLTIAPDGRVTFCEVVSSELKDAELEQKLGQRVLLFQFEPRNVESITTTKPIDFFPA